MLLWYPLSVTLAAWVIYGWFLSTGNETWEVVIFAFSVTFAVGFARAWTALRRATIQDAISERHAQEGAAISSGAA